MKWIEPAKTTEEISKLSYMELQTIFNLSSECIKRKYHPSYRKYYKSVREAIRIELDKRIQNKIFT